MILPRILFVIQFILVVLKRASIIDWNWSSVISVSFIMLIFSAVGLVSLFGILIYRLVRWLLKYAKFIEGTM